MTFYENLSEFRRLPVEEWTGAARADDFASKVFRLRVDYDEGEEGVTVGDKLAELLEAPGSQQVTALVLGSWTADDPSTDSSEFIDKLVSARAKLPNLRALFLGDIISEENEISWIRQCDMSALLAAYDQLENLTVRGGDNLSFGSLQHSRLKELIVQTGGLSGSVVQELGSAKLPVLQHLEIYLGEPNYGGDATVDDLAPLLREASK